MSRLKNLLSDTVVYGISNVVARLIGYLLVPFFTHFFLPFEYGLISLVFVSLGIFNVFYTSGMESAFLKLASQKEGNEFSTIYRSILFTLSVNIVVLSLLLWLAKSVWSTWVGLEQISNEIILLMLGILSTDALAVCGFAALRLKRRAWLFASLKLGQVTLNAALTFYLVKYAEGGITGVFFANFVASTTAFLLINAIHLTHLKGRVNLSIIKQAYAFGLPFIPAGLAHLVNEGFDRFFLLQMDEQQIDLLYNMPWTAEDVVGVYSACYKLAVFLLLIVQMFRMAWQPFFLEHAKDPDAPELFAMVFQIMNALLVTGWFSISLFYPEIAAFKIPFTEVTLIGKAYWGGLFVVPILLAAYIFQGWYVVFTSSIFISSTTKTLAQTTAIGAFITLVGNGLFTAKYGMAAAAITTVVSYFVMSLYIWKKGTKAFYIPYSFVQAISLITFAIVLLLGYHILSFTWQSIGVRLAILLLYISLATVVLLKMKRKNDGLNFT